MFTAVIDYNSRVHMSLMSQKHKHVLLCTGVGTDTSIDLKNFENSHKTAHQNGTNSRKTRLTV